MENNNEKVMMEIKETLEKACKNIKFDFEEDELKREQERLERLRNHYQYEADKYKELNDADALDQYLAARNIINF